MSLSAIILAAGRSTRMKSALPKVLHEICGRPMLDYVLTACFDAGCEKVMVVVGHGKEEVMSAFAHEKRIVWVEQAEQLGTGHAARMCQSHLLNQSGDVFILTGDGPLIRGQVLRTLLNAHREEHAAGSMATAMLDNPFGYGRVVRDAEGNFIEIVEELDASPEQREIREVFPSYYCIKAQELCFAFDRLTNNNKKREYYLTDVFGILRQAGKKVVAVQAVAIEDTLAVNDRQQQADVDAIMQDRIQRQLREAGISIVAGDTVYIESGVSIGRDTIIHPFSHIGRDASIGSNCVVGPFAAISRQASIPDNSTVVGNDVLPLQPWRSA
ncbi:MAG TPA: NTP transferase domain-containing protein [Tepidisphaeraceae bacterium]|jgi:bifunctional UDP-N-acetylglucosamine pyrophosphorylase/glucosamine-1-phosphate N-acetyltransferase